MIRSVAIACALLISTIAASRAETPEQRQACTDDAFRVCNDAIPDQNRVFSCLVQKHTQISPLCQTALAPYLPTEQPTAQATPKRGSKARTKGSTRTGKRPLNLNPNAH